MMARRNIKRKEEENIQYNCQKDIIRIKDSIIWSGNMKAHKGGKNKDHGNGHGCASKRHHVGCREEIE